MVGFDDHRRFTLRQLAVFVAVAESGSISGASSALGVSETSVSSALSDLERALGLRLCIRRRSRGVELTTHGRDTLDRARALLDAAEEMHGDLTAQHSRLAGVVRVGVLAGLAPTLAPPVIEACRTRHPEVTVDLVLGSQDELISRLGTEVDLAVVLGRHLPRSVPRREVSDVTVHAVLPADHPLAAQESVALRDLAHEPLVLADTPASVEHAYAMYESIGATPNVSFRCRNIEVIRSLVGRGLGFSLQVLRPYGDHTYEGRPLAVRPISDVDLREIVVVVWSSEVRPSSRASALIDLTAEALDTAEARSAWSV
ncbi:LysR family transcriptional regulator [Streptomyces sp. NPDC014986]|uniref:LysR family transcriptional regulator n=1 Tax=Streptomyces sp. NPDC014986 TaxID=3364934 RepID=UPI0036F9F3A7